VTDDLAMKALSGAPADLAVRALARVGDIALYCSGEFAPTEALLRVCPPLPHRRANVCGWPGSRGKPPAHADPHGLAADGNGCCGEPLPVQSRAGRHSGDPGNYPA